MSYRLPLSITSEIGRLREVIVHRPGREIEMVSPDNFGRMLFDDILNLSAAQENHDLLVQVLKKCGVKIHYFQDLLVDVFHIIGQEERQKFIELVGRLEGCSGKYCQKLASYSPKGLADALIGGEPRAASLTRLLRQDIYAFPPLPNMMFVRDGATVVGSGVILSSMAHAVRSREVLLWDLIFGHHPYFCQNGTPPWRWLGDFESRFKTKEMVRGHIGFERVSLEGTHFRLSGLEDSTTLEGKNENVRLKADYVRFTQGPEYALEGGSIFVLSEDTLMVGCGVRTSAAALDKLASDLFERRGAIQTILVAVIADAHKSHLDTYFSVVDQDHYLLYAPVMEEYGGQLTMYRMWLDKGQIRVESHKSLAEALDTAGFADVDSRVGYCAGIKPPTKEDSDVNRIEGRINQEREWHSQALNMLAIAPGKLIASARNHGTLDFMEENWGYTLYPAEEFVNLADDKIAAWLRSDQKAVITLADSELSRAHGGPRSLILPLRRDPLRAGEPAGYLEWEKGSPYPDDRESAKSEEIALNVHSETGRLFQVVLHQPGEEIARLTPANKDALLCDDILDLKLARQEHNEFSDLLRSLGVEVYEIQDLLAEALERKGVGAVIDKAIELQQEAVEENGGKWLPSYTESLKAHLKTEWDGGKGEALAEALIAGVLAPAQHPALYLNDSHPFLLTPIPNLLFTRDPAAIVGDNAVVCYMKKPARLREGLVLHYVLQYLVDEGRIEKRDLWFDYFAEQEALDQQLETFESKIKEGKQFEDLTKKDIENEQSDLEKDGELQRVEGGDILIIHDKILAIGCSERTTREILEKLARRFFKLGGESDTGDLPIETIFAVLMPEQRSSMHLDTIFTMISEDECLAHQPLIMTDGTEQVRVVQISLDKEKKCVETREVDSLINSLEATIRNYIPGYKLAPILAGGENPLYQDREQWCDGPNVLAIAPGVVIGYERNYRTFQELGKHGYFVCHARDVMKDEKLKGRILEAMEASTKPNSYDERHTREKFAIKIRGRELSRARGGPRCMSMPLERGPVYPSKND
jgi:arginine deiminase